MHNIQVKQEKNGDSLLKLYPIEENVRVLKEAVEYSMADLHGGAEDDGDVLEAHLVEPLPLNDVHHVHKDPLNQVSAGKEKTRKSTSCLMFTSK